MKTRQEVAKGNLSQFPIGKQSVRVFVVLTSQENISLQCLGIPILQNHQIFIKRKHVA